MDFLEKELEDISWDAYNKPNGRKILAEKGLVVRGKLYRQVNLGFYGRLDLVDVFVKDRCLFINIFELKGGELGMNSLAQVLRYKFALSCWVNGNCLNIKNFHIRCTLIGRSLKEDGIEYACQQTTSMTALLYKVDIEGVHFEDINNICTYEGIDLNRKLSHGELKRILGGE